ncbi:AMP-forming long-chain acyl-CoA synthetase [Beggiatoa alba B18LD]|uniref:AMP-forming long-chain acyl-CoA synthetase n=1 Tax=Beggiatoa alba B18LD TaxID=395493 RepID=I3CC38_9GAMM|nr:long-chain fatty acid--CoA ligase [Beggiatoa alba]EIJ41181.1 AMP-forming long-chain acyl-CoA synthetase [Beggiatoa alba B18LD]
MPRLNASHLADLYRITAQTYGNRPAFVYKKNKEWTPVSFQDLYESGLNLATGLISVGVEARSHVGLLADNRIEWIYADCAVQLCGAADVPRGSDVSQADIAYILQHAEVSVVFVEDVALLKKVQAVELPLIKIIILMDNQGYTEGSDPRVQSLYTLMELGKQRRAQGDRQVEERVAGILPSDLFTLIYTSGTTGTPKGVMLPHSNMIAQIASVQDLPIQVVPEDRFLSILPVWHIFERVIEMVAVYYGAPTYYTNVRQLAEDLKTVRPTLMASAPRLWESIYQRILATLKNASPIRKTLFNLAYACARQFHLAQDFLKGNQLDITGRSAAESAGLTVLNLGRLAIFFLPYKLLDTIVLSKLRAVTGGCFRGTVSGGGALPRHIDEFFNFIGIPILEGYGLTEGMVLSVRTFGQRVIGTVGVLFPITTIRIVDINTNEVLYPNPAKKGEGRGLQGEIHVKGEQVMHSYYKNDEATAKAFKEDGWLNTGDLGIFTFNNSLKITGRSKDTIVLLGGENVEPVPIETRLCQSDLIEQCMLVGQDKKTIGVLLVPALEGFKKLGITAENVAELSQQPAVREHLVQAVKTLISTKQGFKPFEVIQDVYVLDKPFEVGDELTNLFKLKRHVITAKYQAVIQQMYADE